MTATVTDIETAKKLRKGRDYVTPELFAEVIGHLVCSEREPVSNLIAYDEFRNCIVCRAKPPWKNGKAGRWSDIHDHMLMTWVTSPAGGCLKTNLKQVQQAVTVIAQMNAYHPVREYLGALPAWDGKPRIDSWLTVCFGAEDNALTRAYASKTLIAAVARIYEPGCKVDTILVLESKQGRRKSATLKALCDDSSWFLDTRIDISSKDSYQVTQGKWLIEFPELESLRGKEKTQVRSWLSSSTDTFRPSHERHVVDSPRQFIIIGTTNEAEYLDDYERRVWAVSCSERSDTSWIVENRDQLWAEALKRYQDDEQWWLSAELEDKAKDSTTKRVRGDSIDSIVRDWMRLEGRELEGVTTAEALIGALRFEHSKLSSGTKMMASCLRRLGYEHDPGPVHRKQSKALPAKRDRFWRLPTALIRCAHGKVKSEPCPACDEGWG